MAVDSSRLGLGDLVFSARLIEGPKDSVRIVEVVMHNIDKERCIHKLRNEFLRR